MLGTIVLVIFIVTEPPTIIRTNLLQTQHNTETNKLLFVNPKISHCLGFVHENTLKSRSLWVLTLIWVFVSRTHNYPIISVLCPKREEQRLVCERDKYLISGTQISKQLNQEYCISGFTIGCLNYCQEEKEQRQRKCMMKKPLAGEICTAGAQ